jgi:hypothetical protein
MNHVPHVGCEEPQRASERAAYHRVAFVRGLAVVRTPRRRTAAHTASGVPRATWGVQGMPEAFDRHAQQRAGPMSTASVAATPSSGW